MSSEAKVVLVTGASSGFGRAIATALHERGYRVFGTSRRSHGANPYGAFTLLTMDVDREDSVRSTVDAVIASAGRIDILVNNAGFGIAGAIEDTSEAEAHAQLSTNFFGTHRVCRAVLPHMRKRGAGRIVNLSSLGGVVAIPFQGFYSASKFAIEAYSEALRMEVMPFGIHVSMIQPGDYSTAFTGNRRMTEASTPASAYHQRCTTAIARMAEDESRTTDISPVVATVLKALDSSKPRLRYPVANAVQRTLVALRPFMPHSVFEYLIMDNYRIR